MNAHDSERIKGMLEELGLGEAATQAEADVLVFNTCTIREKPDQKFAAHLAQAAAVKRRDPDKVIAVGGCYAEAQRERRFQAWVQISMGCNSKCAYCIVPAVRGREVSRRPGDVVAEVTRLAAEGVREVTLLGQNVNSWGRDLAPDINTEFGE